MLVLIDFVCMVCGMMDKVMLFVVLDDLLIIIVVGVEEFVGLLSAFGALVEIISREMFVY